MNLTELKGVGEKTAALFSRLNVHSVEDLLRYYPVSYVKYEPTVAIGALFPEETAAVEGILLQKPGVRKGKKTVTVTAKIADVTGSLQLIWFNMPYLASTLQRGTPYIFRGKVSYKGTVRTMEQPEVFSKEDYLAAQRTLRPVYSLTKGLRSKTIARIMREALRTVPIGEDPLDDAVRREAGVMRHYEALQEIHFPTSEESLLAARNRLAFDEFFFFILTMRSLRASEAEGAKTVFPMQPKWETEELIAALPYRLTASQKNAWRTIEQDLTSAKPMHRLLQGDVGSGKTILAFLSMLLCTANGYQTVLMAPTEVLANQHFEKLQSVSDLLGKPVLRPCLLTGSMRAKEKAKAKEEIADGMVNCIIGTHAVLEETVHYHKLALVITDEQHRFGVRQRSALRKEEAMPHTLVMSATPIPRTLGIIYYGDLSVTRLTEKPADRLPVKNSLVNRAWRPNAWRFIEKQVAMGHQAYVICAMIEDSEELDVENVTGYAKRLKEAMPEVRIGLLHGRMRAAEKDSVMTAFAEGALDILVSTTVIEVGVDVPNATVMLIEDAERFGLAALHQLRGRVGRGPEQSYCIFLSGNASEAAMERLKPLAQTNDGFFIAEQDFSQRGPGDLLGVRQSGDLRFSLADPLRDGVLLEKAGRIASDLMEEDPKFLLAEHEGIKKKLTAYMAAADTNLTL